MTFGLAETCTGWILMYLKGLDLAELSTVLQDYF